MHRIPKATRSNLQRVKLKKKLREYAKQFEKKREKEALDKLVEEQKVALAKAEQERIEKLEAAQRAEASVAQRNETIPVQITANNALTEFVQNAPATTVLPVQANEMVSEPPPPPSSLYSMFNK